MSPPASMACSRSAPTLSSRLPGSLNMPLPKGNRTWSGNVRPYCERRGREVACLQRTQCVSVPSGICRTRITPAERLQALRQYLRHAAASASWSAEREAHELFGRLHLEHKLASQAAGHLTAAGSEKLLKELGAHLPEERVDEPPRLRRGFRNIRAHLACPAPLLKLRGTGPGRPPGVKNRHRAPRYDVRRTVKRPETLTSIGKPGRPW